MPEWTDNFLENSRRIKAIQESTSAPAAHNGHTGDTAYVRAAHGAEIAELANCPPGHAGSKGRNHTLNVVALKLARLPINRDQLRNDLIAACHANGLIRDDGRDSAEATIKSAFGKADLDGPRDIPERANGFAVTEVTSAEIVDLSPDEQRDMHRLAVERRAYELRVQDEARLLYSSQQAAELGQHAPTPQSLTEFLAIADSDATYRIEDLLPTGGRALLAAQYKAGKTTMMANLLRALADGTDFLGKFHTDPVKTVTLIDTELDERMLRRWLRAQTITNTDNINIVSLRGKNSTFNVIDAQSRDQWSQRLAGSDLIILDCLRPCLDAVGLSEDKEAGRFLVAFDELCATAGASEAVVVHHMGHHSERSRGDSRLLDWPDVLWKIVREHDENGNSDDTSDRYFSAIGRDVNIAESLLDYSPETASLMVLGGNRADKKARGIFTDIVDILSNPVHSNGLSRNELVAKLKALGNGRDTARNALRLAVEQAVVLITPGPRNANLHILNPAQREAYSSD